MEMLIPVVLLLTICTIPVHLKPRPLSRPGGRIIGGQLARAGQFPYSAAVEIETPDGRYFCGGALLDHDWIMTAGQCVDGASLFAITIGSNSITTDEPSGQKVASDIFFLHPNYNPLTLEHDIGLIKLRLPISYTDYIQPINYLSNISLPDGSPVTAIGWGQIGDQNPGLSAELNYVNVVTLSNPECSITYGGAIAEGMLCAEGNLNEGTCIGDIGSPLVQYGSRGYAYHAGIASFLSANGCETTDPSGFTRTGTYRDWIRDTTTTY